jgi:hypothetical protein
LTQIINFVEQTHLSSRNNQPHTTVFTATVGSKCRAPAAAAAAAAAAASSSVRLTCIALHRHLKQLGSSGNSCCVSSLERQQPLLH